MSRSTISTFQLFALIPNAESARIYLEGRLWPEGATCPSCILRDRITTRKGGFYRCNRCSLDFTVRTATIFERSHVPLHKWVYAMYLLVTTRKGISSMQMAKEIGVTQKTAWFMLQRLREACQGKTRKDNRLGGLIEVDECFVGGKEANKHEHKKLKAGRGLVGKVDGMKCPDCGHPKSECRCEDWIREDDEYLGLQSLDAIANVVLAYRPKPKSKGAKRRTRRAKKAAKDAEDG